VFCGLPLIGQNRPAPTLRVPRRPNGAQFHPLRVGETGGGLIRNKNACSAKQDAMVFCGLPLIGQNRPMNGAQFHPLRAGEAGGE